MFYCKNCGYEFEKPLKLLETHNLDAPPFESLSVCPMCKNTNIAEKKVTHCRCCGARLNNGEIDYCSERCRENAIKLQNIENKKRKIRLESPLNILIRQLNEYNRQNNTKLSYGQYVAFILPKMKAEKKKCTKKKRDI